MLGEDVALLGRPRLGWKQLTRGRLIVKGETPLTLAVPPIGKKVGTLGASNPSGSGREQRGARIVAPCVIMLLGQGAEHAGQE